MHSKRRLFDSEKRLILLLVTAAGCRSNVIYRFDEGYDKLEGIEFDTRGFNLSFSTLLSPKYWNSDELPPIECTILDLIPFPKYGHTGIAISVIPNERSLYDLRLFNENGADRREVYRAASRVFGLAATQNDSCSDEESLEIIQDVSDAKGIGDLSRFLTSILYARFSRVIVLEEEVVFLACPHGYRNVEFASDIKYVQDSPDGFIAIGTLDGKVQFVDGCLRGNGHFTEEELGTFVYPIPRPDMPHPSALPMEERTDLIRFR